LTIIVKYNKIFKRAFKVEDWSDFTAIVKE